MISSSQHYGDMGGYEEIPLSTIKSYEMRIPPSGALNMSKSLHLIIGYLLKDELEDSKSKFYGQMALIRD